jgi:Rps23 Pro-64 3,4-dihydroxylase Tpa1-like proline 4-hydroxylase
MAIGNLSNAATVTNLGEFLNPIDREALREQVRCSTPVPNFLIDNFLRPEFAERVLAAYPPYEEAIAVGRSFRAVNEKGKVQVTDAARFPEPIQQLNHVLASPEFCELISYALGIPKLLADEKLVGGGMHQTAARGHLDVHVDFNYLEDRGWHRRANLLVFLNRGWQPEWGGEFELWDADVKARHHAHLPIFNRCVLFETNEISFHGVTAVTCPPGETRKSFAAYYYTTEAPAHWNGKAHSTIFRARPDEFLKGTVAMPAEKAKRWLTQTIRRVKQKTLG